MSMARRSLCRTLGPSGTPCWLCKQTVSNRNKHQSQCSAAFQACALRHLQCPDLDCQEISLQPERYVHLPGIEPNTPHHARSKPDPQSTHNRRCSITSLCTRRRACRTRRVTKPHYKPFLLQVFWSDADHSRNNNHALACLTVCPYRVRLRGPSSPDTPESRQSLLSEFCPAAHVPCPTGSARMAYPATAAAVRFAVAATAGGHGTQTTSCMA